VANVHTAGNEGVLFMVGSLEGKRPLLTGKLGSATENCARAEYFPACSTESVMSRAWPFVAAERELTGKMSGFFALQSFGNRIDLIFSKPESLL
jgi:hypothetical protein